MPHYLVTGGAGFIGSHLCEELVRRGERVRVVDNLITGKRQNLAHLPQVEFMEGDLADIDVARRAAHGIEYVLHQAAIPSVPRSVEDPLTSNRANIDASVNILVAARDAKVKRLVYAGSSSAYGNSEVLPKVETMPAAPLSPYALQKLVAEQYCQMFTTLYGFDTVTIRYFNVFNVATARRISLNQLFASVKREAGSSLEPDYSDPRAGDVRDSQADIGKAQRLLGYTPIVGFEEGLGRTVKWYRESMVTKS